MNENSLNKRIIKPTEYLSAIEYSLHTKKVFLGGTIDMGNSEDWQDKISSQLEGSVLIMNPRREQWDSSWEQTKENKEFVAQVNWELFHLEKADYVIIYLAAGSASPISLLELGLHLKSGRVLICCPDGFYRKGNIDVTAEFYRNRVFTSLDEIVEFLNSK